MKVLFIGGNGNISWWCVKKLLDKGIDEVYILNRGQTLKSRREIDIRAHVINCDIRDFNATKEVLQHYQFDIVCDFICYNKQQAETAISLFNNKISQYIVISTTAVYDRKKLIFPLKENLPQYSEDDYAKNKIQMEKTFMAEYNRNGFPVTIVRPGQTYDTLIPDAVGRADFTNAQRILDGKPVILFGDGTNLWTLTHASDFADAFTELIGNNQTIGEAYHIAGDELLTWKEILYYTACALDVKQVNYICIPSDFIIQHHPEIGIPISGHRLYCDIYDTTKIKNLIPNWKCKIHFAEGIKESVNWLNETLDHKRVNLELNASIEDLIEKYKQTAVVQTIKIKN